MFLPRHELSSGRNSPGVVHSPPISPRALAHRLVTNPDGSQVDVEDNTILSVLDKEHILANMRNRFLRDCIYTYTASVLLAVNPYKNIPGLYGPEMQTLYTNKSLHSMPPHPYAIADTAFRYFQGDSKSQVLVVSGESGSGKTETAKVLISFLANHRDRQVAVNQGTEFVSENSLSKVHDRVISATPILEAFGNASTIRNKNSSRFGKYHRLLYDKMGRLNGAEIKPLLLESSRVTGVGALERNFHVFYLILAGMDKKQLAKYSLEKEGHYPLVPNRGGAEDDSAKFAELMDAFQTVGFSEKEIDDAFRVVAGLLILSQVVFTGGEEEEDGKVTKPVEIVNQGVFESAANLIGIEKSQLFKVLVNKMVKISNRKSTYSVSRTVAQVEATRATLIRTIYKRLFEAIVDKINQLVANQQTISSSSLGKKKIDTDEMLHIGVLDIFGFENLEKNSFEQLCINLTNEKLQEFFIRKVLEGEQKTYQAEGIHLSSNDVMKIPLPDCSETLTVIKGALEVLDDHCIKLSRGMATDEEKYCMQVQRQFAGSRLLIPKFEKAKRTEGGKVAPRGKTSEAFIIKHYAGEVQYSVNGWLEKNNERMSPEMECLLRDASGQWVSKLGDAEACSYACERFKSVRSKFMNELDHLLQMLDKCSVHYIRCFNPNNIQKNGDFNTSYVQDQVVQCGTVELVNVMHHGFPNRQPLSQIAETFQSLLPHDFRDLNPRDFSTVIMNAFEIPETEYAIGFTTLFLKADQVRLLEQLKGCGELPSERVLSTIRKQVVEKKLKRCLDVIRVVVWLPKLMRELRRKKLFTLGAKLAVTLAFLLPRTKFWLETARRNILIKRAQEEEEKLKLRIKLDQEEAERLRMKKLEEEKEAEFERIRVQQESMERKKREAAMASENKKGPDGEWASAISGESSVDLQLPLGRGAVGNPRNLKVTQSTRTVPQLPGNGNDGKENNATTQSNISPNYFPPHAYGQLTKTTSSLAANSLAKLPPVTAMMAAQVELFSIPRFQALLIYDGKKILPLSTNEAAATADPKSRRSSSLGCSNLPSLLPVGLRNAVVGAIAQHPSRPDLFASTETDEVGAITIWRASKGVESRFRIHLGTGTGNSRDAQQNTTILKICFIAPDSTDVSSPVLNPNSHLLAVLVECSSSSSSTSGQAPISQFVIFVEVASPEKPQNSSSNLGSGSHHQFKVHKVEPIPPSQFVSNLNRKISFLKSSASGRIVVVGGKGLLMFFAVGLDSSGTVQVDLLAEQSYFPQIQTVTFLSFISLFQTDPALVLDPADYVEEQLIVTSADGNMLRFPILLNQATCALDISGCGKVKECLATLSGKRITSLVKRSDDAYFTITADGCIDQWVWVDRRPFRDQESSIALVAENSKAMFSTAALLTREVVCFDASAGKVVAFDPTDPDSLNPRLLYQFNSQGVLA